MTSLPNPYAVPLVTIPVAAQLLGMNERTAYRAAAAGELPTITLNGRRHVPVAQLYERLGLALPARPAAPIVDR